MQLPVGTGVRESRERTLPRDCPPADGRVGFDRYEERIEAGPVWGPVPYDHVSFFGAL